MLSYPGDWEVIRLSDFAEINPHTTIPEKFYYVDLESVKDIYLINARRETKHTAPSRARRYARKGDVFFQTVRPYQRNNYIFKLDGDYVFSTGYAQLRTNNNPDFLFYLVRHYGFVNEVLENCTGTSYPAINPAALAKILVHIPPLKEQTAIANTLAAFDTHITNLTELISKKKAIRDGALDDLMTGRTRLKGFCGDWEVVHFDDVIIPKARIGWQGLKKHEYLRYGYSYLISGTDFHNGTISLKDIWHVSRERYDMDTNIQVHEGDVLVTKDGTIGKVAIVPKLDKPATLNSGVFVFRTNTNLERVFLYRVLQSSIFEKFVGILSAGSTIKHLYQKDLKNFSFMLPPLDEQIAISDTLTALDTEISSLETERDRTRKNLTDTRRRNE